jgi:hypothetical protein
MQRMGQNQKDIFDNSDLQQIASVPGKRHIHMEKCTEILAKITDYCMKFHMGQTRKNAMCKYKEIKL